MRSTLLALTATRKPLLFSPPVSQVDSSLNWERVIEKQATDILNSHSHFRGRSQWVQCRYRRGVLQLRGTLPNYHLKQLAQETLRRLDGVQQIDNRIIVASPLGFVDPMSETPGIGKPR